MARVVLIEAAPWDTAGNPVNVYLAGGGSRGYDHRGRTSWSGGLVEEPDFAVEVEFDEKGVTGGALPQAAKLSYFPADKATLTALASRQWINAPLTVLVGDDKDAAPVWTTILTGTVSALKIVNGRADFTIADLGKKLDDPILKARFAGTGAAEGDADIEGRIKRRTWGKVFNVEGLILLKAYNVYEFSDPAFPLNAFTALRDKGRDGIAGAPIAWQGSIAATLAALQASAPPTGGYIAAPSIACVKWWTQPSGPLTADIQGENTGGYVNKLADIASRVTAAVAGPAMTAGTVAATNAIRADEVGIHADDESETVANVLDRLCLGCSILWIMEPAGTVTLRPITFAGPVETIAVEAVERAESYRPNTSRKLAYQRSYRKHTDGEISAAVLLADVSGAGDLAALDSISLGQPYLLDTSGVNPLTASGTYGVLNGSISIAANGALAGGGGGQVTAPGIGVEFRATTGDNYLWNGALPVDASGWTLGAATRQASANTDPVPAYIHWTATVAVTTPASDTGTAIGNRIAVTAGETLYFGHVARGDLVGSNNCRVQWLLTWYDAAGGTASTASPTLTQFAAVNTWEPKETPFAVPANAVSLRARVQATVGAGATFVDAGGFRIGRTQKGATLGADWTTSLTARPSNLASLTGSEGIQNTLVSISSGGALAGAGGGALTALGLEGSFGLTIRNNQIAVASGLITGIGTGNNAAVGNTLISLSAAGALAGAGGGSIAYDSLPDGTTYARIKAAEMTAGVPKITIAGSGKRVGDQRNLPAITSMNKSYKYTGAVTYTASAGTPATATISVAAGSALIGSVSVSYNLMTVGVSGTGGTTVTYFLYADDSAYAGGSPTLVATTNGDNLFGADGRVYFGQVDVFFPSSGTGGGGGSGGGGFDCVAADAWVETLDRGFVQARDVRAGDRLRVLTEDRGATTWEPCESNMLAPAQAVRLISASGVRLTLATSTPITLRDGSTIWVHEVAGHELPVEFGGLIWEACRIEPAGVIEVAHIRCNQRTYAAGDTPGRSILTHNPSKP